MKNSYFSFNEWLLILVFALCGALMNLYLPLKSFLDRLNMTGPTKGMALLALGVLVELFYGKRDWLGGGLGNLSCLGITWIAFGFHRQIWAEANQALLPLIAAFISGVAGVLLARVVAKLIAGKAIKKLYQV